MDVNTIYFVTNRSASVVGYSIPEEGVRREFQPGETKKISHGELEKLTYQNGGRTLIGNFLLIRNAEALKDLGIRTEPEYNLEEAEIRELMANGSLDAFLDCLDFAPAGVIEIIKKLSVEMPLGSYDKRRALKEKTGFDVDAAVRHIEEEKEEDAVPVSTAPTRRVQTTAATTSARRTAPKYNVINQG